jgi:Transcription mediator complex subunit Med12
MRTPDDRPLLSTAPVTMSDDIGIVAFVPDWVPEFRAGVRADVYPVSPHDECPAELVLDRDTVTAGYAERCPPYEFTSLLDDSTAVSPPALAKIRTALALLRKSRPAALQRVPLPNFRQGPASPAITPIRSAVSSSGASGGTAQASGVICNTNSSRKVLFPVQKPSAKSSLEDWFNKLSSGGSFSTSALSKSVPLGPAIVRAVGKVLEMMADRNVPTQRAVWYIRIAVLNECVKQIRPDRPAPSPRVFWTRQLCGLFRADVEAMRSKKVGSSREVFWHYVLDLVRWQGDEGLLDITPWLKRIAASVKTDAGTPAGLASTPAGHVALRAAEVFLPEFRASRAAARLLCDALVASVEASGGPVIAAVSTGAKVLTECASVAVAGNSSTLTSASSPAITAASPPVASTSLPLTSAAIASVGFGSPSFRGLSPFSGNDRAAPALRVVGLFHALFPVAFPMVTSLQQRVIGSVSATELASLVSLASTAQASVQVLASQPTTPSAPSPPPTPSVVSTPSQSLPHQQLQGLYRHHQDLGDKIENNRSIGPHGASRLLERLPSSGDVSGARTALISAFAMEKCGGPRSSVTFICAWAIRGPMRKSHLAVHIASTMIGAIANTLGPVATSSLKPSGAIAPMFQDEIWQYVKTLDSLREKCENELAQDSYGYFVDPQGADDEDVRVARLLVCMLRAGQISLSAYLKETSRLVSISHPSAQRHLFYISTFPEPTDRTVADSRRALLRRGQRLGTKCLTLCGGDEKAISAVCCNDVDASVEHGTRIKAEGHLAVVFATAEAVMGVRHEDTISPEERVLSVVAYLSSSGAQMMAVEWLLRAMQPPLPATCVDGKLQPLLVRSPAAAYALDNLAPCVAASGQIYVALERMADMYEFYQESFSSDVLSAIEATAASYSATFSPNAGSGNLRWASSVCRLPSLSRSRLASALLLGNPDCADSLPETVLSLSRADLTFADDTGRANDTRTAKADPSASFNVETCLGPSPDLDLQRMAANTTASPGLQSLATFVRCGHVNDGKDTSPPSLGPWATANAVLGCVVVPEIKSALQSSCALDFAELANVICSSLELLSDGMHAHDLCGARPTLVIELIALLAAAAIGKLPSAAQSLGDILAKPWVRTVLLPRVGASMVRRLQVRVEDGLKVQCVTVDGVAVTQIVFDSMVALFGGPLCCSNGEEMRGVDEGAVIRLIGWVEWGVTELLLAVIISYRAARDELYNFANGVSDAASDICFCEQIEMLVALLVDSAPADQLAIITSSLGQASVRGLGQGFDALVAHVHMESSPGGKVVPQAERELWAAFDSTRCAFMKQLVPFLPSNVTTFDGVEQRPIVRIVTALLEQFKTASSSLRAPTASGVLRPDFSSNGTIFSSAVESRFTLIESLIERRCFYFREQEQVLGDEGTGLIDALRQELTNVVLTLCDVIVSFVPLLLPSAVTRGIRVLGVAVDAAESSGVVSLLMATADIQPLCPPDVTTCASTCAAEFAGASNSPIYTEQGCNTSTLVEQRATDPDGEAVTPTCGGLTSVAIRVGVESLLTPAEVWLDDQHQASLRSLYSRSRNIIAGVSGSGVTVTGDAYRSHVCAFKLDGTDVDTWYLLEGYGRGAGEDAAVPPQAFGVQGTKAEGGRPGRCRRVGGILGNLERNRDEGVSSRVVRLKRTYSTYACMAVR